MTDTFLPTMAGGANLLAASATESVNRANYLSIYMKMVFAAYKDTITFQDLVTKRTLSKGAKSGVFFFTGNKDAKFLGRAETAQGSPLLTNSKTIELDDIMYSDSFVADVDEQMSVLSVITDCAREDGIALAKELDYEINIMINKASSQNHPVNMPDGSTRPGGTEIVLAAAADEEDAEKLVAAFKLAAQTMDEKNVPAEGRYLAIPPSVFYTLLDSEKLLNIQYSKENGDFAKASIKEVIGFTLKVSNLIVDFNPATEWVDKYTGLQDKYNYDCSNTIALAFNKDVVGVAMARDMKIERAREMKAQGEFVMVTMLKGVDTLNPVGAVSIKKYSV